MRGEWFKDRDGARTGTSQTLTEGTVTPELRLTGELRLRADVRLDHSDRHVFGRQGTFATDDRDQWTVLLAGLCTF